MPGPGVMQRFAQWSLAAALAILLLAPMERGRAGEEEVDLALILAIDCSFSVDANEFRLQMEGLGQAFMSEEVKEAIRTGPHQRIAVSAYQWSDVNNQLIVLPWTVISGDADADELGRTLSRMQRRLAQGGTSISTALMFGAEMFSAAPPAQRRVIDVSSDGRNNMGPPVAAVRDRLVASGITINALAILNEWPTLDVYFESQLVGGQGNFVIPANDYPAYGEAIFRKLLKEITGPGIS